MIQVHVYGTTICTVEAAICVRLPFFKKWKRISARSFANTAINDELPE